MSSPVQSLWATCLDSVSRQVSGQAFRTWFEPLKPVSLDESAEDFELTLEIPSRFYRDWIDQHYNGLLHHEISRAVGKQGKVSFRINGQALREEKPAPRPEPLQRVEAPARLVPAPPIVARPSCNTTYTFDAFVEGTCNRLARSAAQAIARKPGDTAFNPFFVYGGVGLGKTHLIQAIANEALATKTAHSVQYVSSEQFTNDFVRAIQNHKIRDFSTFYRQMDLLIVDDVQFFSGKEKIQEEFFNVFNDLHLRGKQVILCADRQPREITGIEERLKSRFGWGLIAEIQPPDLETRLSILRSKASSCGLDVSEPVLEFIAQRVHSNIRELEGALKRLQAHMGLHRQPIDLEFAFNALKDLVSDTPLHLDIPDVQRVVAEHYKITVAEMNSRSRTRDIAGARQVAMYFAKQYTSHTLEKIGNAFGGRDHSTVIHALTAVSNRMDVDTEFTREIKAVQRALDPRGTI